MTLLTTDLTSAWADFFVAEAGAAAALTGLVFVAVSINLTRILEMPSLPAFALETLVALASVLVVASFGLVPGQSTMAFGLEIGAVGLLASTCQVVPLVRQFRDRWQYGGFVPRAALNVGAPLCFVAAGVMLAMSRAPGMYWLVPGTLLSFAAGLVGAWVLLVEILR